MSSSTCFYLRLVTQFHTDHSHLPMALPPQHGRAHQTARPSDPAPALRYLLSSSSRNALVHPSLLSSTSSRTPLLPDSALLL